MELERTAVLPAVWEVRLTLPEVVPEVCVRLVVAVVPED